MKLFLTETQIQADIIKYLEHRKFCFFRMNTKGEVRRGKDGELFMTKNKNKGFADIFMLHKGHAIFLEVKTDVGKMSKDQQDFANTVITNGCSYFVVRSKNDVKLSLESIGVKV